MLFINFLCLLYLMVLVTSHTLSRSYAHTEANDDYYGSFNDIALKHRPRNFPTRHERCFGKKQKHAEAKLKAQTEKHKDEKEVKEDSEMISLFESPQEERGKVSNPYPEGRRVSEKWRDYYTKLSRYIATTPIYNYIHNMGHKHPQDLKKGNTNEHTKVNRMNKVKRSKNDRIQSNLERPPIKSKRSLRKMKGVTVTNSHSTRRRYTSYHNKDITLILSEMSTKLDELRRLYATTEPSYHISNEDIIAINDAQYDDRITTSTEPFEGTAAIEELLNEVKMRAIDMIAKNLPSVTGVIANAVTETTYTVDPMLKHTEYFNPVFALSTLLSINDIPKTVTTIDPTEPTGPGRDRDDNFRYFVSQTEPSRRERSAFANSTRKLITLTQDVEEIFKEKVKSILDNIRGKAKPATKCPKTIHKYTNDQKLKTDSHKNLKATNRPSEATNSTNVFDINNVKHKREREKYNTLSLATPFMEDSDYGMLALYEHMLAKSQESNMLKFLSTKLAPTLKRDLRETSTVAMQKDPIGNDENFEIGDITSAPPVEAITYEALSKKLSYNDFVDGFKHYLKFEKEMGNSNFSNMVRYQAHKHHDVDKIGKYILDKIPQIPSPTELPSPVQDRYRRGFDDNYDDDQDVSTKSEDSWLKRHFFYFVERSSPKKFHTSEMVPLKSPVKEWSSESRWENSKDHEFLKANSVGKLAKEKTLSENLDELSAHLQRGDGKANLDFMDPYSYHTEEVKTALPHLVRSSRSPRLFHKILGMGRQTTKPSPKNLTPKAHAEEVKTHRDARVRRHDDGDKQGEATTANNINQTDPAIAKDEKKKLSFANVNIVPADEKKKKKKGRIHKFFEKYMKKKKKTKGDKGSRSRREAFRRRRFNIVHSLKKIFDGKPRSYLSKGMYDEDFDLTTKRLEAFTPIKYDKLSNMDDIFLDGTDKPAAVEKTPTKADDFSNESKMNEILKEIDNIDLRVSSTSSYPTFSSKDLYTTERAKQKIPKKKTTKHLLKPEYNVKIDIKGADPNAQLTLARNPLSKINDDYGIDTQLESSRVQVFNNKNNREFKIQKQIDRLLKLDGVNGENSNDDGPRQATTYYHVSRPYENDFRDYERSRTTKTTQSEDYIESSNWRDALREIGISVSDLETTTESNLVDKLQDNMDTKMKYMIKPDPDKWKNNVKGAYVTGEVADTKRQFIKHHKEDALKYVTKNRNDIALSLDEIIGGTPQQSQEMKTKYNQNLGGPFMDSTIFAYDDSIHYFNEDVSNKPCRSSIQSEMEKYDTHGSTKLTPPQQHYTTPLPMESLEFDKFLKTNDLDVHSLTLPLVFDTTGIEVKYPKRKEEVKAEVIEKTKVRNLENFLVTPIRKVKSVKSKESNERTKVTDFVVDATKSSKSNILDKAVRSNLRHRLGKRKLQTPVYFKHVRLNQKAKQYFKEPFKDDQEMGLTPNNFDANGKLQDIHDSGFPLYDTVSLHKDTLENMKLGKVMTRNPFSEDNMDRASVQSTKTTPIYKTNRRLRKTTNCKHNKLLHYSKVPSNPKKYLPKHDKHSKRIRIDELESYKYNIEYVEDERLRSKEGELFKESAPSITPPPSVVHDITSHLKLLDMLMNNRDNKGKAATTERTAARTYPMKIKAKETTERMKPQDHHYSKQTTAMAPAFVEKLSEYLHRKTAKTNVAQYSPEIQMKYEPIAPFRRDSLYEATTESITNHMGLTRSFFNKFMGRSQDVTKSKNPMPSNKSPKYEDNGDLQDDEMPTFTPRREKASRVGKRQAKSFTAKNVEDIEVIVDLVQSTTSRPASVVVDKDNVQDDLRNAVRLRIALPSHKTGEKETRPVAKLRKVFSAKLLTPVDLEYQIRSITYEETTTSKPTSLRAPKMYLLVENVDRSGAEGNFLLKPLDQNETIRVKARQADITKEYKQTQELTTTPTNKPSKVTLSKDIISAVNEQLHKLYDRANSNYSEHNIVSREVNHGKKRRWINWKKLKKYFQNDRACNCKCRVGKTMCPACAASDAVMGELLLEIKNLVSYMSDHCTEIQTYFLMNPSGGKKLRDAVKKVDRSLQNYYKRVKGKCHGKTCDAYRFIDNRNFIRYSSVPPRYIETKLTDDIEKVAYDINNATQFKLCLDNKLKEGSYRLISLISNCANDSAEKHKVAEAKKKLVKNVYSLDNVHVNIVCDTEPTNSKVGKDQMTPEDQMTPNDQINDNGHYTGIVPEYDAEKHDKAASRRFWLPHLRKTTSNRLKKRETEPNNIPLNADSGGSFWVDFFNKDRNKNTSFDFNKESDDTRTKIIKSSHVSDANTEKTSIFDINTENFLYTYTAMPYSEPETNPPSEQGAAQSLTNELKNLFKLLNIQNVTESGSASTRKTISAATKRCEDCIKSKKKKEKKKKCKSKCKGKSETKTTKKAKPKTKNHKSVTIKPDKTVQNKTTHPGSLTFQTKKVNADKLQAKSKGPDASVSKKVPSELLNKIIKWKNATLGLLQNNNRSVNAGNLTANDNDEFLYLTVLDANMSLESENIIQRRTTPAMRMFTGPPTSDDVNPTIIIVNENHGGNNKTLESTTNTDTHVVNHDNGQHSTMATTNAAKKVKADLETNIYKNLLLAILKYEGRLLENDLQRVYGKHDNSGNHKENTDPPGGSINVRVNIVNETQPQSVVKSTTSSDYGFLARLLQSSSSPRTPTTESMMNKIFNKLTVAKGTLKTQSSTALLPNTAAVNNKVDNDIFSEGLMNAGVTLKDYMPTIAPAQPSYTSSIKQKQDETSDPSSLCDLQDTLNHILTTLDRMNQEHFITNISCHKYRKAPEYFYIIPDKIKRQDTKIKWDWIRSKRSLLQVPDDEEDDSDEDVITSNDEAHSLLDDFASNDGFEKLYRDENGVYRSMEIERKKRTVNDVKALSRELRNLPPIVVPKNEMYVMVGDSVTLTCPLDVQEAPYSWWMESGVQDNVHVDGPRLFIRRATPENIGTYTCSKDGRELSSTRLRVVSLPRFRVVFMPVYRSSRQCNNYDLRMIHQLGKLMTEAACPGGSCYVRITHPTCSRDEVDSLLSLTATVVAAPRAVRCGVQCRRDVHCGMAFLAAGNAPVLATIPVIISSEEGNVTLTPVRQREGLRQVLRNTDWAVPAVGGLSPGEVDVVLTCPAGYFLVSASKICVATPPAQESVGSQRRLRRYDWWQPSYLVLGACVVCGAVCAHAVGAVSARGERPARADRVVAFQKASTPAPCGSPRRKISPSRVILPRLFRNASSRISHDTKLDFGLRCAPPLPPIDFDS